MIERIITIQGLRSASQDRLYWLEKTPVQRLQALEMIRRDYNAWRHKDVKPGFQRVYRIVKRA